MQTTSSHPAGLVLGTGLTALGVVRSLARAGVPALCLSSDPDFESHSRWYRGADYRVAAFASAQELSGVLERIEPDGGVLIPCSDHWAVEITRLRSDITHRFRICAPATDIVAGLIDKATFRGELVRADVPHPFTEPIAGEDELSALMARAPDGVFLKPADSQRFVQAFGQKAFRVSSSDDAAVCWRRAREQGIDLVLQEYIPGGADRHYFVDGFVGRDQRIDAAFARRRLRMHPPGFGNSSAVVSVPIEDVSAALDSLASLFLATGYRGIFSAEFKLDERDGVFKLLEVNCRPWWYVEFAARCGVNVVEMAYLDALGRDYPRHPKGIPGVELVYGYYDFLACRRLRRAGEQRALSCVRSWLVSDKAVFTWDDPFPAVWNVSRRVRSWFRRRIGPH